MGGYLKGVSARHLRQEFPPIFASTYGVSTSGPPSYFAGSCGGAPLSVVKNYIENQKRPN
ncbi:transposase [Mycolicibacterium fortuitum]|uniref:transposase n=1 Tax=Mycolicibacterium fortuitum TaxID=1766 RepID=UPI0033B33784